MEIHESKFYGKSNSLLLQLCSCLIYSFDLAENSQERSIMLMSVSCASSEDYLSPAVFFSGKGWEVVNWNQAKPKPRYYVLLLLVSFPKQLSVASGAGSKQQADGSWYNLFLSKSKTRSDTEKNYKLCYLFDSPGIYLLLLSMLLGQPTGGEIVWGGWRGSGIGPCFLIPQNKLTEAELQKFGCPKGFSLLFVMFLFINFESKQKELPKTIRTDKMT